MAPTVSFAEQESFAEKVTKEKAIVQLAMRQNPEENGRNTRKRLRKRGTRDGQEVFVLTFFNGTKPKKTDWHALDARNAAACAKKHTHGGSNRRRPRQSRRMTKSSSAPCLSKRDRTAKNEQNVQLPPFQVAFPLPLKGAEMRKEAARSQADFSVLRPEAVTLSPTVKWSLRKWGLDVNAFERPDGTKPPRWSKVFGHTSNKWANQELVIRAAREKQEFFLKLGASSSPSRMPLKTADLPPNAPLPPWVKDLPPVRDVRKQLASRLVIPFLDQHSYPEGGVAEAKRARRREKEAFLRTDFVREIPAEGCPGNHPKNHVGNGRRLVVTVDEFLCRLRACRGDCGRNVSDVAPKNGSEISCSIGPRNERSNRIENQQNLLSIDHPSDVPDGEISYGAIPGGTADDEADSFAIYTNNQGSPALVVPEVETEVLASELELKRVTRTEDEEGWSSTAAACSAREDGQGGAERETEEKRQDKDEEGKGEEDFEERLACDIAEVVAATATAERLVALARGSFNDRSIPTRKPSDRRDNPSSENETLGLMRQGLERPTEITAVADMPKVECDMEQDISSFSNGVSRNGDRNAVPADGERTESVGTRECTNGETTVPPKVYGQAAIVTSHVSVRDMGAVRM